MSIVVNQGSQSQTLRAIDTVSLSEGNQDGETFCGTRSYAIVGTPPAFVSLVGDQLTAVSTDPSHHGSHTVTISVTLDSYTSITENVDIVIVVTDLCVSTSIDWRHPGSLYADMSIGVDLGSQSQTLKAIDTTSLTMGNLDGVTYCGTRTYAVVGTPQISVTIAGDQLSAVTTDPTL